MFELDRNCHLIGGFVNICLVLIVLSVIVTDLCLSVFLLSHDGCRRYTWNVPSESFSGSSGHSLRREGCDVPDVGIVTFR